jgi:hypothetical protein
MLQRDEKEGINRGPEETVMSELANLYSSTDINNKLKKSARTMG